MSKFIVLDPFAISKEFEVDRLWVPPTIDKIRSTMGEVWYKDRIRQGSNWLSRKEHGYIGKAATATMARNLFQNRDVNVPFVESFNNKYYKFLERQAIETNGLIQDTLIDSKYDHIRAFEQYQCDNVGYATWNWDYDAITRGSIATIIDKNKEEIKWDKNQYALGLQEYFDNVAPTFDVKFKYNLLDGIMVLPAGSFWSGPEATASKRISLQMLQEGLPLFGTSFIVKYDRYEIMSIRRKLSEIGYFDGRLQYDNYGKPSNIHFLTIREILIYEMCIKQPKVEYWIQMLYDVFKEIGHPLKPGLRVQHAKMKKESTHPKLRIFLMNFILQNVLFSPIIHWYQSTAIKNDIHHSWVDKGEMIQTINKQIQANNFTKFLSVDYSKFDHTVPKSLLYWLRRNYVAFAKQHSADENTRRILTKLESLLIFMTNRTYILYPEYSTKSRSILNNAKKEGNNQQQADAISLKTIYLRNQLASGVIDTQLAGTLKSQADIRVFLLNHGIQPGKRIMTLSDDILVMLTEEEYAMIGKTYSDVNNAIGAFFHDALGAEVNPLKQPPSHDWGVFLQYMITTDPNLCGYYSRVRTISKMFVAEFQNYAYLKTQYDLQQRFLIDRIGQFSTLLNLWRTNHSDKLIDDVDVNTIITRLFKVDALWHSVVQSNINKDNRFGGVQGAWFVEMLTSIDQTPSDLTRTLGETTYSKSGLRDILLQNSGSLNFGVINRLPIYFHKGFDLFERGARMLTRTVDPVTAHSKLYKL